MSFSDTNGLNYSSIDGTAPSFNWPTISNTMPKRLEESPRYTGHSVPIIDLYTHSSPQLVSHGKLSLMKSDSSKNEPVETKLMLGSDIKHDYDKHRPSSVSTCGDLEEPHRLHDCKAMGTFAEDDATRQTEQLFGSGAYEKADSHRSRSRTSNMSIKRSNASKQPSKADPERKRLLMHQVARYWNECIGLADEEKAQAKAEIDSLRHQLHRQQAKLKECQQRCDSERTARQDVESKLEALHEENVEMSQENTRLQKEVDQLKDSLAGSKEKAKALHGKYRVYRAKLNEAIVEQQRLFTQAKDLYSEGIQDLRQENEARLLDSEKIERALEVSYQKRAEMKECIDELRSNFEHQIRENQGEIAQLKANSVTQDQALQLEKKASNNLQRQLDAKCTNQDIVMKELSTSIRELQETISAKASDQPCEIASHVQDRLQNLEEAVQTCAAYVSTQADVAIMVQNLEEKVTMEINPALCSINQGQNYTNDILSLISNGCAAELGHIRTDIEIFGQKQLDLHDLVADRVEAASNEMEAIRDGVVSTRQICGDIGHSLENWFMEERQTMTEKRDSWEKNVFAQLAQRSKQMDELKKACDNATQLYMSKINELRKSLATKEDGKQLTQNMLDEFRFVLDYELCQDKAKAEHDAKQTQSTLSNLETQISTIIDQLRRNRAEPHLGQNQETVSSFKEMVRGLQAEAKVTADLRNRWHSDVKLVDSMRSHLESVQKLIPHINRCHQTVDDLARVGNLIDCTSRYIDTEHHWVRGQLQQQAAQAFTPSESHLQQPRASQTVIAGKYVGGNSIDIHNETTAAKVVHLDIQEVAKKRVHVHGAVETISTSNALSVEEEQKRRRDPIRKPSILKFNNMSSSQETAIADDDCHRTETELGPVHKYRKCPAQVASSSEDNQRIIHEIGSSFLAERARRNVFELPRITDYQPLPANGTEAAKNHKHKDQEHDDENDLMAKRMKLS